MKDWVRNYFRTASKIKRIPHKDKAMMIPSRRLSWFLGLGCAIAVMLALFFPPLISIGGVLLYDGVILALAIRDAQQVRANRVKIDRSPLHTLSIGRENPVILTIESLTNAHLLIQDNPPPEIKATTTRFSQQIAPNTPQTLNYTVYPLQRGEFTWGSLQARQLGKLGLGWYQWDIASPTQVAVYPDLVGLRSLSVRLTLESAGNLRRMRRLGIGTEFAELREYHQGDDLRLIDWKATARRSRPFVRVLEADREQTLIILLDRGRLMTSHVQGLLRFDWGLNATLSLALAALHRGDRVGVGVFDRQVTTWIPPERGISHLSRLIERLTPIQPVLLEPDYLSAVTQLVNQQTRRALVVLLTDIIDVTASSELLGAMGRLTPRYLPFCITLRDPQVDQLAHTPTTQVDEAYTRAVALDLLSQRETAFAQLKQKGVLVLDAPANQISEHLVERYLQLKAKNLL